MDPAARSRGFAEGVHTHWELAKGKLKPVGSCRKCQTSYGSRTTVAGEHIPCSKVVMLFCSSFPPQLTNITPRETFATHRVAIVYSISARRVNPVIIIKYQLPPSCVQSKVDAQHVGVPGQSRGFPQAGSSRSRMDKSTHFPPQGCRALTGGGRDACR